MKSLDILVDLDATVAHFFPPLWVEYERRTGEPVTTHQIKTWDMSAHVTHGAVVNAIFRELNFFRGLQPMPGALEVLQELFDEGHNILIATAPCTPHSAAEKYDWVGEHLPYVKRHDQLYIGGDKSRILADILVDDGPHNAAAWVARNPKKPVIGIAHPYNEDSSAYWLLARGHDAPVVAWRTMAAYIRGMANE